MEQPTDISGDTAAQQAIRARINRLLSVEMAALDIRQRANEMLLTEFEALREVPPAPLQVLFSGGTVQTCWRVTRSNGAYSLIFLPTAGYFSLCVDSVFGPVDIGVHGPALQCFASV